MKEVVLENPVSSCFSALLATDVFSVILSFLPKSFVLSSLRQLNRLSYFRQIPH